MKNVSPLSLVVLSFSGGILFARFFPGTFAFYFFCTLLFLFFSFFQFDGNKHFFILALSLSFFFSGATLFTIKNNNADNQLYRLIAAEPDSNSKHTVYGKIITHPQREYDSTTFLIAVTKLDNKKIDGIVKIKIYGNQKSTVFSHIGRGYTIKTACSLWLPNNFDNPGGFDYVSYLKFKGIRVCGSVKSSYLITIIKKEKLTDKIIRNFRHWLSSSRKGNFSTESSAFIAAITVGDRSGLTTNQKQTLMNAGIYHIIALSGLHIFVMLFLLNLMLSVLPVSKMVRIVLIIFFLLSFLAISDWRPSIVRAVIMALLFYSGKLLYRKADLKATLSASALIVLVYNPFQLFDIGFILTYSALISIISISPVIEKYLSFLPQWLATMIAVTMSVQLGTMALTTFYFNRFSPSFLLSNIMALPLLSLILLSTALFYFLYPVSPSIASIVAIIADKSTDILFRSAELLSDLMPSLRIPSPSLLLIGSYYFLLLLFVMKKKYRKKLIIPLIFFIFLPLVLPLPKEHNSCLTFTFIDVGQGESILVEFPDKKTMLIDGGGFYNSSFQVGDKVVSPLLWEYGYRKIDYLLSTHSHSDHVKGLVELTDNFKIGEIWTGPDVYGLLRAKAKKYNIPLHVLGSGMSCQIEGVKIKILHPSRNVDINRTGKNNASLVLSFSFGQYKVLLTGDIEKEAENEIVKKYGTLNHDVLKVPHHGSSTSSTSDFLERVSPSVGIISCGKGSQGMFPSEKIVRLYKQQHIRLYSTGKAGAISVKLGRQGITVFRP